jgi:type III pantothenate kinase
MLGTDTESALVSGIINGTVGAVENIVRGIEEETHMKLKLILTGGQAGLIASVLKREHVVIPDLIFEGMRLIYNLHKEN